MILPLKKLFGKDEKFYDLLEESAAAAQSGARYLSEYLRQLAATDGIPVGSLDDFSFSRRKDKRITQQITEELCRTFVTPLDREDIEALSLALYRIPKIIEKIAAQISIYPGKVPLAGFQRQAELLERASAEVAFMVGQLRRKGQLKLIQQANERLQFAEGEADKLMFALLKELYRDPAFNAKETMILQETFELVEKAVDRCRDAGNVVFQIVLKYS
jgi:uncharacterized protein Yka (UPF0111/DUF47 family)